MAARTARCAVLHAAHVVWICVGLLQHITRAAQAQIFNICVDHERATALPKGCDLRPLKLVFSLS